MAIPAPEQTAKNPLLLSFREAVGDEESRSELKTLRARFLAEFTLSTQCKIPSLRSGQALRGVYPERQSEILRSAQNDKRRARNDSVDEVFTQTLQPRPSNLDEKARLIPQPGRDIFC